MHGFSAEKEAGKNWAGVAIVISSKPIQYIEGVEPTRGRPMCITIRGTPETNIICKCMPTADRPEEENDKAYEESRKTINKMQNKGPIYIAGDWTARLIYPSTDGEEQIRGKLTLHTNCDALHKFAQGMVDNRDRMIDLAVSNKLIVLNFRLRSKSQIKSQHTGRTKKPQAAHMNR